MPSYELILRARFSAAHRIRLANGCWEPLHGHNWRVEVHLEGADLDDTGIVADFSVLQSNLREVVAPLNNSNLNDVPALADPGPSTERVAKYIYDRFRPILPDAVLLGRVRVWETDDCAAGYVADGPAE